jgi:hypothetical protein
MVETSKVESIRPMQKIYQDVHKGFAKDNGTFQFQSPNAKTFNEAGFSPLVSEHLAYLLHAQLGTHQCKESFKKDYAIVDGQRKNATVADIHEAQEGLEGIYSYNFSGRVKQRASSKWGELKAHVPSAIAAWKSSGVSSPTDDQIRERALIISQMFIVPVEVPQEEEDPENGE